MIASYLREPLPRSPKEYLTHDLSSSTGWATSAPCRPPTAWPKSSSAFFSTHPNKEGHSRVPSSRQGRSRPLRRGASRRADGGDEDRRDPRDLAAQRSISSRRLPLLLLRNDHRDRRQPLFADRRLFQRPARRRVLRRFGHGE